MQVGNCLGGFVTGNFAGRKLLMEIVRGGLSRHGMSNISCVLAVLSLGSVGIVCFALPLCHLISKQHTFGF